MSDANGHGDRAKVDALWNPSASSGFVDFFYNGGLVFRDIYVCNYGRNEANKSAARHIGFKRVGKNIDEAFRSAVNGAIRRGLLGYGGGLIWRTDEGRTS